MTNAVSEATRRRSPEQPQLRDEDVAHSRELYLTRVYKR